MTEAEYEEYKRKLEKARAALKPRLVEYVESITRKSKGGYYVCPLCGSGTGRHGTGAFSVTEDGTRWKCFACQAGGDLFALIGAAEQIQEPIDQLRRAAEIFGIDLDGGSSRSGAAPKARTHTSAHTQAHTQPPAQAAAPAPESLLPYIKQCSDRLPETDYHTRRGLSAATANRFSLGYDPAYPAGRGVFWKALVIPTGFYSVTVRNTDPDAEDRYRARGGRVPLNLDALKFSQQPVFIVEGEIDAMSICEVGGEAVGLGSKGNTKPLLDAIKAKPPAQPLIIALDADTAGEEAAAALEAALDELGVKHYKAAGIYGSHKDANEALTADREAFAAAISEAVQRVQRAELEAAEAERDAYRQDIQAAAHLQEFINGIAESVNTPVQSTGFPKLDAALDGGLYEGLYIIGAITSLGKTTLAMQLADQIAASGRDVLIFSLEMARTQLMSKSISRLTLQDVLSDPHGDIHNAKTSRGITVGARYAFYSQAERELIQRAVTAYGQYAEHIYIHEGMGDIGIDKVRAEVEKHTRLTGSAPVVFVDYMQILAPYDVRATDKQNTDKAVLEMKRLSRDFKIPVIGISSFNRTNYSEEANLAAYKESGSIEYSADVLIGLQLTGAGGKNFNSTEAKRKNPREVELVILKNREAPTGDKIDFRYYAMFNYFAEA